MSDTHEAMRRALHEENVELGRQLEAAWETIMRLTKALKTIANTAPCRPDRNTIARLALKVEEENYDEAMDEHAPKVSDFL